MSGFEIIGVVLGAAPLIISALEGYQKLDKKRDAFLRKSLHIDRMIRALTWQQRLIHGDIEIVLRNAGFDEATIDQCGDLGSYQDLFNRRDVQDAMNVFLGKNCLSYVGVVRQCESTLFRIAKALNAFEESAKAGNGSLAAMTLANQQVSKSGSAVWKRIKFSMHKDDLESSIKEIDGLSQVLGRLREQSEHNHQILAQSVSSNSKTIVSILQKVQSRASNLYKALAQSWVLSCHDSHGARLYLDHRMDGIMSGRRDATRYKQNTVKFGLALQDCSDSLFRTCVVEAFTADDLGNSSDNRNATVAFLSAPAATLPIKRPEVDNICRVLQQTANKAQSCKLYLVEKENFQYESVVYDTSDCRLGHMHAEKMMCLKDLLQDPSYKRVLKLKLRVKLAATMASSILQLHTTPWCTGLRCESVWFVRNADGTVDLESPLVFCDSVDAQNVHNAGQSSSVSPEQAESKLLDLGVMILELWHNETIDTFAQDLGLAYDETFDRRQSVARRWIAETKDDMLTSIYDATVRCVNCRFDAVNIDLMDRKLNVSIFDGVVRPLAESCRA